MVDDDGDDDESYYRQPSKYDYSGYTSSRRRSRSKRRKTCRHECKKSKRYKPYKSERRKKPQPNRTRISSDSSSDGEFKLDRNKLQAALKRNTTASHSTTLKRKLIGVSKTVEDYIKEKEDDGEDDISTSIEIMHLLNKINIEEIAPKRKESVLEDDDVQELRLIALKSAIMKKAEARKKRKIIETQPYSPTDDVSIENVLASKLLGAAVNTKPKDDLDAMEISPAVSPIHENGCVVIDMELESDDESQKISDAQHEMMPLFLPAETANVVVVASEDLQNSQSNPPVPDVMSLMHVNVPEVTSNTNVPFNASPQPTQQQQQRNTEDDDEDAEALRASLLANMKAATLSKKKPTASDVPPAAPQKSTENESAGTDDMEHLRKQVFSSMGKRKQLLPNPFAQKFKVQVPKPMEMTMPQITSNLKEALKRIKERDKQNVETETNVDTIPEPVSIASKEIPIDINKAMRAEILELKNIAHKLNGGSQFPKLPPPETNEPANVLKATEPAVKVNDVLKNVTSNNAPVDNKTTKEATIVPLVVSNKIETSSMMEKSETAIRSLKAIAQKKVIAEPNVSLNQKENQQLLQKVVAVPVKRTTELPAVKKAKISNVKASRVITTPVEKPVNKMIIRLDNSDTDSDDFGFGQHDDVNLNGKSYSGVASPVSYGYTFSPSSPALGLDPKSTDAIPPKPNNEIFQRKLDEYLKSARTKVEQTKLETKPVKKTPSVGVKFYFVFRDPSPYAQQTFPFNFSVGEPSASIVSTRIPQTDQPYGTVGETKIAETNPTEGFDPQTDCKHFRNHCQRFVQTTTED